MKCRMNRDTVSTVAGTPAKGYQNGEGTVAQFFLPTGIAVDEDGNIIVADADNHCIRRITPQGHVSTLAGTGEEGYLDGEGTVAQFNGPAGVAVDGGGNVIVADAVNHRIRKITPEGQVSTLAGSGEAGEENGEGTIAEFNWPSGVAVDEDGNVIVADTENHSIRVITPQGLVSTLAGTGEEGYEDGEGTWAEFCFPFGVAVDGDGNVIVADTDNHCIRKITPQGQVSTLAGTGEKGHRDGEGTVAEFNEPKGVAVDGGGNIIVADASNDLIRQVTAQGQVSTLAGTGQKGHQNGDRLALAQFTYSRGVAVDANGHIIVADTLNHCIRLVAADGVTPPASLSLTLTPLLQSSFISDIQLFQRHLLESGCFHDVCFMVEQERVPAHRSHLSARCEYFRCMFSAGGFQEGDGGEIRIEGTSSAAFKALLKYLYTDDMEIDDAGLFDLAVLCDQYQVERLHNYCVHQIYNGITVENAVMRLVQAHTANIGENTMWDKLKSKTVKYVMHNFEEIRCNARESLELLDHEYFGLFKQMLLKKFGAYGADDAVGRKRKK
jgi:DNA-binding beta-propeller fold protein YncE